MMAIYGVDIQNIQVIGEIGQILTFLTSQLALRCDLNGTVSGWVHHPWKITLGMI